MMTEGQTNRNGAMRRAIVAVVASKESATAKQVFLELARAYPNADIPTVASVLASLARDGLLERPEGQRGQYKVTEKGLAYLNQERKPRGSGQTRKKEPSPKRAFNQKVRSAILDYLSQKESASQKDLRAYLLSVFPDELEAVGYLPLHLRKLLAEGRIQRLDDGSYAKVATVEQVEEA